MSPGVGFVVCFALTLAALGLVFATGLRARRKLHVGCVALTFAMLAATIHYAYALGRIYDLPRAGWITPFHLTLARVTTAAFLLPVATGLTTIFRPRTRPLHRKLAFLVLALTVTSAVTGAIMLLLAPRHA